MEFYEKYRINHGNFIRQHGWSDIFSLAPWDVGLTVFHCKYVRIILCIYQMPEQGLPCLFCLEDYVVNNIQCVISYTYLKFIYLFFFNFTNHLGIWVGLQVPTQTNVQLQALHIVLTSRWVQMICKIDIINTRQKVITG